MWVTGIASWGRTPAARRLASVLLLAISTVLLIAADAAAQDQPPARSDSAQRDSVKRDQGHPYLLEPVNVTATRRSRRVFETPQPVSVVDVVTIEERSPNTVSDLFRSLPGLDVTGVGTNQVRPVIRGQRGQRILLVQDGIRLSNTRRQQDFGEIPALIDVSSVERVEIVRGPASVLYGSDAIGGVVNIITRTPASEGVHGSAAYRYSSPDAQNQVVGRLSGRLSRFGFVASGSLRGSDSYQAPNGSFGDITLAQETRVHDTGVRDGGLDLLASYDLAPRHQVSLRYARYRAEDAGFGQVDPKDYTLPDTVAPPPSIQILYPSQSFDKLSAGYRASGLNGVVVDQLDVTAYAQDNERRLDQNIVVPLGPPGASVAINSHNFTDVETWGVRVEAKKLVAGKVLLTYGADFFRDASQNTDADTTTVTGFGPPAVQGSTTPRLPFASYRSGGLFVQGDWSLASRASVLLGARYQNVHAETEPTPGLSQPLRSETDQTVVGTANAIVGLTDRLSVVGGVGRAFRSPNLVERFFSGVVPEGGAVQTPNPDLGPETSLNLDLGLRYRGDRVALEGFVFRTQIFDGIRIQATGDSVNGLPEYRNVNVEELRFIGVELAADLQLPYHLGLGASYTHLDSEDVLDQNNPVGDSYSSKFTGTLRYSHPSDRFWVEYDLRVNGDRKDADIGLFSVVGPTIPGFTVHSLRAGATLARSGVFSHRVGLALNNLTNQLYAESSNAGFFRPEPKRGVMVTYGVAF